MSSHLATNVVVTKGREALSRAVRQAIQALIPTLIVIAAGGTRGLHVRAVLWLAALTAIVSLLKSVANLRVSSTAPLWEQLAERAVTAAAGTAIGLVTVDGFIPRDAVSWQQVVSAAVGSAALAAAMYYTNPPIVQGEVIGPVVDEPIPGPVPAESRLFRDGEDRYPGQP